MVFVGFFKYMQVMEQALPTLPLTSGALSSVFRRPFDPNFIPPVVSLLRDRLFTYLLIERPPAFQMRLLVPDRGSEAPRFSCLDGFIFPSPLG